MDWTEKYRPQSLDGVIGNPSAVNTLRSWAESWKNGTPSKRALVLMGSPGIGKTTSAEALAREMGWTLVEMNASDQRNEAAIRQVAILGSHFNTFSDDGEFMTREGGHLKLIVLDEADHLFGNVDRGAIPAINDLIRNTQQPVILIVNDFYEISRKSAVIKNETLQITFKRPTSSTVSKALYRIAEAEGIEVEPEAMELIAVNANGDMRAAVRNLESLSLGNDTVTLEMAQGLSDRSVRKDMFQLMSAIFRSGSVQTARDTLRLTDTDPETLSLWVDENLPREYPDKGNLVRGYENLSRADIFLGRVSRRQYYGFWSYASDLLSCGTVTAKWSGSTSHERISPPMYLSKMSRSRSIRNLRKSVTLKLAVYLHTSTKRVELDVLPFVKRMVSQDPELRSTITERLELEPDELAFLMGKKTDSKEVVTVFKEIEARIKAKAEALKQSSEPKRPVEHVSPSTTPQQVPKEPVKTASQQKPASAPRPKGQRSLFDF